MPGIPGLGYPSRTLSRPRSCIPGRPLSRPPGLGRLGSARLGSGRLAVGVCAPPPHAAGPAPPPERAAVGVLGGLGRLAARDSPAARDGALDSGFSWGAVVAGLGKPMAVAAALAPVGRALMSALAPGRARGLLPPGATGRDVAPQDCSSDAGVDGDGAPAADGARGGCGAWAACEEDSDGSATLDATVRGIRLPSNRSGGAGGGGGRRRVLDSLTLPVVY